MKCFFTLLCLTVILVSCKEEAKPEMQAVVFDGISKDIKPGDNFFNHVNKIWMDSSVIADDQVGVGAYRFLNIPQQELLKNILQEVSAQEHPAGSVEQQVGDFYASGMDTIKINKLGIKPIEPILQRIAAINDTSALTEFVATQLQTGDYSMFAPYISPDQRNSEMNILHLAQTGLGLPV